MVMRTRKWRAVHLLPGADDVHMAIGGKTHTRMCTHRVCSSAKLLRGGGTSVPVALMRRAWWGRERRAVTVVRFCEQ